MKNEDKMHPGCSIPVLFVGDHIRGSFFMCSTGQEWQKTYLSEKTYKLISTTTVRKLKKERKKEKSLAPLEKVHRCIVSPTTEIYEMLPDKDHTAIFHHNSTP